MDEGNQSRPTPHAELRPVPPPAEFREKCESCPQFSVDVMSWQEYPCSLYFDSSPPPSEAARDALHRISELLGPRGQEKGCYGAGGGSMHVMYLGCPAPPEGGNADNFKDRPTGFPPLLTLLDMLHLNDAFSPPSTKWMATLDPLHQVLMHVYF